MEFAQLILQILKVRYWQAALPVDRRDDCVQFAQPVMPIPLAPVRLAVVAEYVIQPEA
jgi:hypothetical protein